MGSRRYATTWLRRVAALVALTTALVAGVATAQGAPAAAADGVGGVSGSVTGPDGEPIASARVSLNAIDGFGYGSTTTAPDGSYTVTDLPPGAYRAWFQAPAGTFFINEYFGDTTEWSSAQPVVVVAGAVVADVSAALALGGSLSGVVTSPDGSPLAGVSISARQVGSGAYGSGYTGADGSYTVTGLLPGSHVVAFSAPWGSTLVGEYFDDALDAGSSDPVTVTAGQDTPGIDASLAEGGSILGRVTDPDGSRVEGVSVYASPIASGQSRSATSAADGTYAIIGLAPGSYRLQFSPPPGSGLISEYHRDTRDWLAATPVVIAGAEIVEGIDAALALGGSIHGVVTTADGAPLVGVSISASGVTGTGWSSASSGQDGSYTLAGLPAGDYRVSFGAPYGQNYVNEYFDDAAEYSAATLVSVSAGTVTNEVDASLATGGGITGRVTGPDGGPVAGAMVSVSGPSWTSGSTLADGTFTVSGLAAGAYRVSVSSPQGGGFITEYFGGTYDYNAATLVTVAVAELMGDIDVQLDLGGSIAGTVTGPDGEPVVGAFVSAQPGGGGGSGSTSTEADGSYTISGLAGGAYRVSVSGPQGGGYITEYFGGTYDYNAATLVTVAVAELTGDIDVQLDLGGSIAGTVTGPDGEPVVGASVNANAQGSGGSGRYGWASTAADGSYTISGLRAGAYAVGFEPPSGSDLTGEYFDDAAGWDTQQLVDVVVGQTTTGIDAALALGGSISGLVTGPDGAPIGGVNVWASGGDYGYATTSGDGSYTLRGLAPGTYTVQFSAPMTSLLVNEYFDGAPDQGHATVVEVVAGATTEGISASLELGGSLSGRVTGPDGAPVAGVNVSVSDDESGFGSATTAADGTFTVNRLRSGAYRVWFEPDYGSPLAGQFFGGVYDSADAQLVSVVIGAKVPGVNAVLAVGGSISGVVTASGGSPAVGVQVSAWNRRYEGSGYAMTGPDGSYTVEGLSSGSYEVHFSAASEGVADEYFDDKSTPEAANEVPVVLGAAVSGVNARLEPSADVILSLMDGAGAPAAQQYAMGVEFLPGTALESSTGWPQWGTDSVTITSLRSGTPGRVVVGRASGDTPFVVQYFRSGAASTSNFSEASVVTPVAGAPLSLAMTLRTGAQITGVVRNADGTAAPGRMVVAFVDDGSLATRSTMTGADGSYTVRGLLPGTYEVAVAPAGQGGLDVFYLSGTKPVAPNVTVTGTATTSGVDITVGARFADVQPAYPFASFISWLAERGISTGWVAADGSAEFRPTLAVTREAMAAFLYRDAGSPVYTPPVVSPFADVPTDYPFYKQISWLAEQGISTGWVMGDGTAQFRPTESVTREAMAAFLYRAAGKPAYTAPVVPAFTDVAGDYPFYANIAWLAEQRISTGWVMGDGTAQFRPTQSVTREAMAAFLQRADGVLFP